MSKVPQPLRDNLVKLGAALAIGTAAVSTQQATTTPKFELGGQQVSQEVALAYEMGRYFESSYRHIGTPYVDRVGKGQPLTVCNGVTGPKVVAGKTYSRKECERLELPHYLRAEKDASHLFVLWDTYNPWVRASFVDMIFNLGTANVANSTMLRNANHGDLVGACKQQLRFVFGTVNGQRQPLPGLTMRRGASDEICREWGQSGHFSTVHFEPLPAAAAAPAASTPAAQVPTPNSPEPANISNQSALVVFARASGEASVVANVTELPETNRGYLVAAFLAALACVGVFSFRRK